MVANVALVLLSDKPKLEAQSDIYNISIILILLTTQAAVRLYYIYILKLSKL